MSKIRVLPDQLANQIAAGEVVERPASIVKELLENAIDAGATSIRVDIEAGGRRLIRVSDNGDGMVRDDAILAFERHATSKIKVSEDLHHIVTLGFRGEALASIAAVSKVRLQTKVEDSLAGTEVEINGGKLLNVRDSAAPKGSTFEIKSLFFNVPARLKFLKSEATESYHVANLVTHYALANPLLDFTFTNNGRETIRVTKSQDVRERAYQLFGGDFVGQLIEVRLEQGALKISGFVSSPAVTRTTRDAQYFFVNGRYVRDKVISRALSDAYRASMPAGVFPAAMLFIALPPEDVDVNVHPAKTEVRFVRSAVVHDAIRDAVRGALGAARAAATPLAAPVFNSGLRTSAAELPAHSYPVLPTPSEATFQAAGTAATSAVSSAPGLLSRDEMASALYRSTATVIDDTEYASLSPAPLPSPQWAPEPQRIPVAAPVPASEDAVTVPPIPMVRFGCLGAKGSDGILKAASDLSLVAEDIKPMGQLHNSFIIAADRSGLLIIDQHVAHERILFEQHWRSLARRDVHRQGLLVPLAIDLTPAQASAFDQIVPELEANGFELGRLSGRTVVVKAVPAAVPSEAAQALLISLLESIEQERRGLSMDEIRAEIAASLACRAAIKINMLLTPEKMHWLIDELLKCNNPATCPHGRPIILRMTSKEIEKSFQRI